MQIILIKQREAEEEYMRCHKQTKGKCHCADEYQKMCTFQTKGGREGPGHISRSGANNTKDLTAAEDGEHISVTGALCSGMGQYRLMCMDTHLK